jgi:phage baseplate assembly protein W
MATQDKYTVSNRKSQIYSDFFTNLVAHPDSKQLVRYINEDAVKKSIRNLILTDKYERLFQPRIGSNIRKKLFEQMTPQTAEEIKTEVRQTIEHHEPRAKLIEVTVVPIIDDNYYAVNIVYSTINITAPTTISIKLYRVR